MARHDQHDSTCETADSYSRNLENHVIPRIGGAELTAADAGTLNKLYAELLASGRRDGRGGLSPWTVGHIHTMLHRRVQDAVRWDRLSRNPADAADPPKAGTGEERPDIVTWDQATPPALPRPGPRARRAVVRCMGTAGHDRRGRGEILGLRWSDVDLDARKPAIRQSLTVVQHEPRFESPKTAKGRRGVALDPGTVEVLRAGAVASSRSGCSWARIGSTTAWSSRWPPGDLVHPGSVLQGVRPPLPRVGKLPHLTVHWLRHTWATLALEAGVHPRVVQERLGHSTIAVTLDTYSHVSPTLHDHAAVAVAAGVLP